MGFYKCKKNSEVRIQKREKEAPKNNKELFSIINGKKRKTAFEEIHLLFFFYHCKQKTL